MRDEGAWATRGSGRPAPRTLTLADGSACLRAPAGSPEPDPAPRKGAAGCGPPGSLLAAWACVCRTCRAGGTEAHPSQAGWMGWCASWSCSVHACHGRGALGQKLPGLWEGPIDPLGSAVLRRYSWSYVRGRSPSAPLQIRGQCPGHRMLPRVTQV